MIADALRAPDDEGSPMRRAAEAQRTPRGCVRASCPQGVGLLDVRALGHAAVAELVDAPA